MTCYVSSYLWETEEQRKPVLVPHELLFDEKQTHNVYLKLARAHENKTRSPKKNKLGDFIPSPPSAVQRSSRFTSSPLQSRSAPKKLGGKNSPGTGRQSYASVGREQNKLQLAIDSQVNWSNLDKHSETSLMKACGYDNFFVAEQLLTNGAFIDCRSSLGETALMHACSNRSHACVKLLLAHAADVNAKDTKGWTAYSHALQSGCHEIVQILQQARKSETNVPRLAHSHPNQNASQGGILNYASTYPPPRRSRFVDIPQKSRQSVGPIIYKSFHREAHRERGQTKPRKHRHQVKSAYGVIEVSSQKQNKNNQEKAKRFRHAKKGTRHRERGAYSDRQQHFPAPQHEASPQGDALKMQELQQIQFQLSRVAAKAEEAKATIQYALERACKTNSPSLHSSDREFLQPKRSEDESDNPSILGRRLHELLEDVSLVEDVAAVMQRSESESGLHVESSDVFEKAAVRTNSTPGKDHPLSFAETSSFQSSIHEETSPTSQTFGRRDSLSQEQVVHYAAHFAETHDPHDHRLQGCLLFLNSGEKESWAKRYVRMDDSVQHLHTFVDEAMQIRCEPTVDLTKVCGLAFEQSLDQSHDMTSDSDGKSMFGDTSNDLSTIFSVVVDDSQAQSINRLFFSIPAIAHRNRGMMLPNSRIPTSSDSVLLWIGRLGRMCQLAKEMKDRKLADLQKLERTAFEERQRALIENVEKGVQARAVAWEIEREHAAWQADSSTSAQVELSFLLQLAREKFNAVVSQAHNGISAADGFSPSDGAGEMAFGTGQPDAARTVDVQGATEVAKFVLLGWRPNGKDIGSMRRHRLLSQLKEHVFAQMVAQAEHRARESAEAEWVERTAKINKEEVHNTVRFTFQQLAGCLIFLYYGYKEDNNLIAREDKVVARAPPGNKQGTLMRRGSVKTSKRTSLMRMYGKSRSKSLPENNFQLGKTATKRKLQPANKAVSANEAVKAATKWQSLWRARQARLQVVKEVQMRGTLLAMPGTIQGQSGWYERLNADALRLVTRYNVDSDDNWSRIQGPIPHSQWRLEARKDGAN